MTGFAVALAKLWPHGDEKIPFLRAGMIASAPAVFARYGITSPLLVAHVMAQGSHECGAGHEVVENIHYTAERAAEVWPTRFSGAADVYGKVGSSAGDPEFSIKLIDHVYGGRMGNRPGTHDGSTFIGRGFSQTTGRDEYDRLGKMVGLDLVNHPELLLDPEHFLECGVANFVLCGCLPFAQRDDVVGVTKRLNGGIIGLPLRREWLTKWKLELASTMPAQSPPIAMPPAAPLPHDLPPAARPDPVPQVVIPAKPSPPLVPSSQAAPANWFASLITAFLSVFIKRK